MRWYYLGQALKPLGVDVEIASSASFHKYLAPPKVESRLHQQRIDGLLYHWVRTHPYTARGFRQVLNQIEFILGCYLAGRQLRDRRPDIVIASSPHPLVNFPAAAIAHKTGADFMVEVRDLWPEVLLELGSFSRWHPYILALKAAERHGVKRARRIISVKPGDGEYFQREYGISAAQFCYIPNGFLPDDGESVSPPIIEDLRRKYRFIVGYVGALSAYYGLDSMLELARRFKGSDIGFVLVGKGDRERQLADRVVAAGLTNCHLVGAVPKSTVSACLARFDACYVGLEDLTIHRYGISCNKIYEYMHAGKPILGSYAAGYDPVAAAGCGIIARPGDYEPLVEGLEALIKDERLRHEYGERAKAYFDANHDFRVVAKSLVRQLFQAERG